VTIFDEGFGQVGNHAFGTTVEARWDTFVQGSNLGDSHL
jgi:hypothetical protein